MNYTIRTLKGVVATLRKMYLSNRQGLVFENVKTIDLDEYINITVRCLESKGVSSKIFNNPICIRAGENTYTIVILIKASHGYNTIMHTMLDEISKDFGYIAFKNWFEYNIK